jgi:hypothetical protein
MQQSDEGRRYRAIAAHLLEMSELTITLVLRGELLAMALKFERLARFADDAGVPRLDVQPEFNGEHRSR